MMLVKLTVSDLPTTLCLLSVEGFVLLPQSSFPLVISDPQSREVLDAAELEGGFVGLIQEREGGSRFYDVGCLGHIVPVDRDEEAHRIVIEGLIRFRVREELPRGPDGLLRVAVSYEEFAHDLDDAEEELPGWNLDAFKEKLIEFGRSRFGTAGILEQMPPRQVVRFMAQTSPFTPAERQALLEAQGFQEMLETLFQLLALNFLTTTPDPSPEQAN
jgi:hypothetical protein